MSKHLQGNSTPYCGVYTALITPWLPDGSIDWETLKAYVQHDDHQGLSGWVVAGTTGEGMMLAQDEYCDVIRHVTEWCPNATVIAGVTGLTTSSIVDKVNAAEDAGADAALILTPYYIKPSQEALIAGFNAVHDATSLPMIIYHNPGRTGVGIDVDTLAHMAQWERCVGVKDSTHDVLRPLKLRAALQGRPWALLCGEDEMFLPYTACGGSGIISVQSGVIPLYYNRLSHALIHGHWAEAQALACGLVPLHQAMSSASNPVPIKTALAQLGWGSAVMRAVVGSLTSQQIDNLRRVLEGLAPVMPDMR